MGCPELTIYDYFRIEPENRIKGDFHDRSVDARGNVVAYLDDSGNIVASYNYSPFGTLISQSGPMVGEFAYKFSTKPFDPESGLYYYNYRYYSPELGRWLSRDPIGEKGGWNLYLFVRNRPAERWDILGLGWTNISIVPVSSSFVVSAYFDVDLAFESDDPCCLEWKMVQFGNVNVGDLTVSTNPDENDVLEPYPWTGWQGDNISDDGWFLDNLGGNSPYYSDNGPGQAGGPNTSWWSWLPWANDTQPATLEDKPGYPPYPDSPWPGPTQEDLAGKNYQFNFAVFVICTSAKPPSSAGDVLGTLTWSGTITDGVPSVDSIESN